MQENKIKHMDYIQAIVTRMASNSFMIKGWSVAGVSAIIYFSYDKTNVRVLWIGLLGMFGLWMLDGYYISMERRYIAMYNAIRVKTDDQIDFSLNHESYNTGRNTWIRSIFSCTLSVFYFVCLLSLLTACLIKG